MIRDLLEVTRKNLESDLPLEERACAELIMYRILETARQYKTLIPVAMEYIKWFQDYERGVYDGKKD